MWRPLLVVALVAALGLTAVEAGGFPASTEDMTSFSQTTSLTPPCTPTPLGPQLWIRNPAEPGTMGTLDLDVPGAIDNPGWTRHVNNDFEWVWNEENGGDYVTWATPAAPMCGYVLDGYVTLLIEQDGSRDDHLSAGLFICPVTQPARSTTDACSLIAADSADDPNGPRQEGYFVSTLDFDQRFNQRAIPQGSQLRLKVVNQNIFLSNNDSNDDWHLRWGYRTTLQARLAITP